MLSHEPTLQQADPGQPFLQTLRLSDDRGEVARAHWCCSDTGGDGVVQIITLWVRPDERRRGHGARLMKEAMAQARKLLASRRIRMRRAWVAVEQKHQIIARAFLTAQGFHHTGTLKQLLRDEDLLIYVRDCD